MSTAGTCPTQEPISPSFKTISARPIDPNKREKDADKFIQIIMLANGMLTDSKMSRKTESLVKILPNCLVYRAVKEVVTNKILPTTYREVTVRFLASSPSPAPRAAAILIP